MAFALTFSKPVVPKAGLPVVKIELGPLTANKIRRTLGANEVGLTEGPYIDKGNAIADLMHGLRFIDRDKPLELVVLSLAFFFSPDNANLTPALIGTSEPLGTPKLVGLPDHIHETENPLVAGELVAHSRQEESSNIISVSTGEEVYLLLASILRTWGFQAQLGLIGSAEEGGMYSVLCVLDNATRELLTIAFPTHPATKRILIMDDKEAEGVVHFLNSLNRAKRFANATSLDDGAVEQLALCSAELELGRAIVNHPLGGIIEGLRSPLVTLPSGSALS